MLNKENKSGPSDNEIHRSKFIIIEGPDNVGKGTQIKLLHQNIKDRVFHTIHYSGLNFKKSVEHIEYSRKLYNDMFKVMIDNRFKHNFIFDRSHIGEMVYAPLYRKYDGDYVLNIEKSYIHILKDDLYLIVFIDSPDKILKRDDGLSYYKNESEVNDEVTFFVKAYYKSNIVNKLLINIKDKTIEDINNEILKFIE